MCGRYALIASAPRLARLLGLLDVPELPARYNIAPSQSAPVVVRRAETSRPELILMRWGLVPSWAKKPGTDYRLINAKAETLAERPAFRNAYRRRRCLIPASGFYEWKKSADRKQPYYIAMESGEPLVFAGLWERWRSPDDEIIESFAIITTEPNALVSAIHTRMPAILEEQAYHAWLAPNNQDLATLQPLLGPYIEKPMVAVPVSSHANSPHNDDPRCIEPLHDH